MSVSFEKLSKEAKQGKVCSCGKKVDYRVSGVRSHIEYWCKKCRKDWLNPETESTSGNRGTGFSYYGGGREIGSGGSLRGGRFDLR